MIKGNNIIFARKKKQILPYLINKYYCSLELLKILAKKLFYKLCENKLKILLAYLIFHFLFISLK